MVPNHDPLAFFVLMSRRCGALGLPVTTFLVIKGYTWDSAFVAHDAENLLFVNVEAIDVSWVPTNVAIPCLACLGILYRRCPGGTEAVVLS